jgi:hypothetical protein
MPSYTRKVEIPGKSSQELYETVCAEIQKFTDKLSVGKFEISHDSSSKEIYLKSSMVTATLCCLDQALELDAKLSLMAAPFRSKIDDGIDRWLAKTFDLPTSS